MPREHTTSDTPSLSAAQAVGTDLTVVLNVRATAFTAVIARYPPYSPPSPEAPPCTRDTGWSFAACYSGSRRHFRRPRCTTVPQHRAACAARAVLTASNEFVEEARPMLFGLDCQYPTGIPTIKTGAAGCLHGSPCTSVLACLFSVIPAHANSTL